MTNVRFVNETNKIIKDCEVPKDDLQYVIISLRAMLRYVKQRMKQA